MQMNVSVIQAVAGDKPRSRFGEEDISHLGTTDVLRIFRTVAPQPGTAIESPLTPTGELLVKNLCDQLITHAAMLIYSDPEHPHNLTGYLPRASATQAMTHGRNGWALVPVNIIFPPMVRRAIGLLFEHQPISGVNFTESSRAYHTMMEYLRGHEVELSSMSGGNMKPILLRNADLMQKVRLEIEHGANASEPNIADLLGSRQ
jgi:hypothetical protein